MACGWALPTRVFCSLNMADINLARSHPFQRGRPDGKTGNEKGGKGPSHRLGSMLKERADHAEHMAKSPTVTVTLRIPVAFDEWLGPYRHLSYPLRVGKQELVVEGIEVRLHAARATGGADPGGQDLPASRHAARCDALAKTIGSSRIPTLLTHQYDLFKVHLPRFPSLRDHALCPPPSLGSIFHIQLWRCPPKALRGPGPGLHATRGKGFHGVASVAGDPSTAAAEAVPRGDVLPHRPG